MHGILFEISFVSSPTNRATGDGWKRIYLGIQNQLFSTLSIRSNDLQLNPEHSD